MSRAVCLGSFAVVLALALTLLPGVGDAASHAEPGKVASPEPGKAGAGQAGPARPEKCSRFKARGQVNQICVTTLPATKEEVSALGQGSGAGLAADDNAFGDKVCLAAAGDRENGWHQTRTKSCQVHSQHWMHYIVSSKGTRKLVGQAQMSVGLKAITSTSAQWVNHVYRAVLWQVKGSYAAGVNTMRVKLSCGDDCEVNSAGSRWHAMKLGDVAEAFDQVESSGDAVHTARIKFKNKLVPPATPGGAVMWSPTREPDFRCENLRYLRHVGRLYGGCIFPDFQPTFTLSLSDPRVYYSARHILRAQKRLADHWGANYSDLQGESLSRWVYTGPGTNPNRRVACRGFVKRSKTDSCDEYPFASTYQGAYWVGRARTSTAHVPLNDNRTSGARLGAFYKRHRIIDRDRFWVGIRE